MLRTFDDFHVGDLITFSRKFSAQDYKIFYELSGDHNPLHHSEEYAISSGLAQTIVPLHLMLAQVSRVAGMNFPGVPSLYLGHKVRAINQLNYGEMLRYSAKIVSLSSSKKVLTVRVLGLRGADVIFDAEIQTQALFESWDQDVDCNIIPSSKSRRLLVTGSSGEIGASVAKLFSENGWSLLLHYRGAKEKLGSLINVLPQDTVSLVEADLDTERGINEVTNHIKQFDDIGAVIHTASPSIKASLEDLVYVNYKALKSISDASLPQMLANQSGVVLSIGSTALLSRLQGWDDYAAAKSMAAGFLDRLDRENRSYGIFGKVLAPTYVASAYSKSFRGQNAALLPHEVAIEAFDMVSNPSSFMRVQNVGSVVDGIFGFGPDKTSPLDAQTESQSVFVNSKSYPREDDLENRLLFVVKSILKMSSENEIIEGGLGIAPGWDSLAQIQIILAVENELGLAFTSNEIETTSTFRMLLTTCRQLITEEGAY